MADTSSSATSLAWVWVIEYLASSREVDASLLQDLIEEAPDDLPEDLGKNAREMVALRCLEELFDPSKELVDVGPSAPEQKVAFDLLESCEDVLQSILEEASVTDLRMAGLTLLKWDVRPFIMHKRASMPKCALEQLTDAILDGTHPHAASLKELGGMVDTSDKNSRIPADCNGSNGSRTNDQIMAPEGNSTPPPLENETRVVADDSRDKCLMPFKRDRSDLAIKGSSGDYHGNHGCKDVGGDLNSKAKRFKQNVSCSNQSVEQSLIPLLGKEVVEDSSKRMVRDAEKGDFQVDKESEVEGLGEEGLKWSHDVDGVDEFWHNHHETARDANRLPQDTSIDKLQQHILVGEANDAKPRSSGGVPSKKTLAKVFDDEAKDNNDLCNQQKLPYAASSSRSCWKINADEMESAMELVCIEDASSGGDEHDYDHEGVDVAMKNHHCLSLQCTSHNFLEMVDQAEHNLCVKSGKGGQLVVCSAVGHDDLLDKTYDNHHVGRECDQANHEDHVSEDNEQLIKPLASRIGVSIVGSEGKLEVNGGRNHISDVEKEGKEIVQECSSEQGLDGQQGPVCIDLKCNSDDLLCKSQENISMTCNEATNECRMCEDNNYQFQKRKDKKQQIEPLASHSGVSLLTGKQNLDVSIGAIHISNAEKGEEEMVQECPVRGLDGQQDHVSGDLKWSGDEIFSENSDNVCVTQRKARRGIQKEECTESPQKFICGTNIDGAETSVQENDKSIISNYSLRSRRTKFQYSVPVSPQLRRKKVPWTAKEEEILKEGVHKFSCVNDMNIPWKKILEHGSSIFLNGRTTVDLKDKWRNMCKGSPKS